jgi:antitoxin (DNA-binding transcriptional repressor) of toxin-antitoxin stability system
VRAGEAVVVTDRGRPVAKLILVRESGGYDAFVAGGRIAPGPGRPLGEVLKRFDSDLPPDDGPAANSISVTRVRDILTS